MPKDYEHQIHQDPDLPSYQCQDYQKQLSFWEFVSDMYEGRSAWFTVSALSISGAITDILKAARYLPQEHAEPEEEYVKRLARSYFDRKFGDAIDSSAGFLSFTLGEDVHENIKDNIENIDLCGNNLEVFLRAADIKALRDDRCFIIVEFPKYDPSVQDAYTEKKFGRRPYFVLVDCRNVINWDADVVGDKFFINQVTIRETYNQRLGLFGSKELHRYRVLRPGSYQIFEEIEDSLVLVEEGQTSLDFVPLVPYCLTPKEANPFIGKPPLYDIAELNLKLYQKQSEKDEAMHKANMAILSVQEIVPTKIRRENEAPPVIRVGPNTCFWNVNASFVEPSGSALAQTQADIDKLELTIEKKTLAFQSGYVAPPTATEIIRDSATAQASLGSMARAKESAVQQLFDIWAQYMNAPGKGGTITVNKRLVESGMDIAKAGFLLQMRTSGELTRRSFLEAVKKGEILDKNFDVDTEVEALGDELESEKKSQLDKVLRDSTLY